MPTLVQEFDTRQFEQGVIRVRQGLDTIEREALAAGIGFDRAFADNEQGLRRTTEATRDLGTQTGITTGILGQLRSILPAITAGFAVNEVIGYANAWNDVERSVQTVVPNISDAGTVTGELADIAAGAGLSLQGTAETFQLFSIATQELNLSQSETIDLVGTLSTGLSLFATSTGAASAAQTQLAQAFASGRLQGDEFRSIAENFPPLIDAIAEVLGVARSEVRDFASDGQITAEVLNDAFGVLEERFDSLGGTVERTASQSFTGFLVRLQEFVGQIDNSVGVTGLLAQALDNAATNIGNVTDFIFPDLNEEIAESNQRLEELRDEVIQAGGSLVDLEGNTGLAATATRLYNEALDDHRQLLAQVADETQQAANQALNAATAQIRLADAQAQANDTADQGVRDFDGYGQALENAGVQSREAAEGIADAEFALSETADSAELTEEQIAALDRIFAEFAQTTEDTNRQGRELAETFDFIRRNSSEAARELEVQERALQQLIDGANAFEDQQREAAEAAEQAAAASQQAYEEFFDLFRGGVQLLGDDLERIIGEDATEIVQRFASLSNEEIEVLSRTFEGLVGAVGSTFDSIVGFFGFGEEQVQSFGDSSISTFTDVNASVEDLQGALGSTSGGLSALGSEAELSTGQLVAFAGAASAVASGIADIAGASQSAQTGAGIGAAIGALIGGAATGGSPVGAFVGSTIGSFGGAFLGDLLGSDDDAQRRAEQRRLQFVGLEVSTALRNGFVAGIGDLAASLSDAEFDEVIQSLEESVGGLNEVLGQTSATLGELGSVEFPAEGGDGIRDQQSLLLALSNSAAVAADTIADEFQINIADVLSFFNALPPGTADSFAAIEENAQFIAEQLAIQFGIGIDEALALLADLGVRASASLAGIEDPLKFLAVSLADNFGIAIEDIQAILQELPEGSLDSFSDLANNAELIARNIAVTLGVTFEEALAIVREFARQAGVDISDVGTSAQDVGNQIVDGFSGTEANLTNIFFQLASLGEEAFENIRTNADGSLRLVDDQAQRRLESIVAAFGGTEEDIQLILRTLAENSDLTFNDIFTSGAFAFGNLSDEAEAKIRQILEDLGFTALEIAALFGNITDLGVNAFDGIEQSAAAATASILQSFGLTDEEIQAILTSIAENGQISFSDLEGASGEALRQILENFGLAEEQINFILDALAGNGAQSFADLAFAALSAAGGITEDFLAAFRAIIEGFDDLSGEGGDALDELTGLSQSSAAAVQASFTGATTASAAAFQSFASSAGGAISALGGQAAATASAISGSFAAAAGSAAGAFSAIISQARSAQAAIRAVRAPTLGPAAAFADGGIIEGPTLLGGAAAGQAFQFGGVLPGLTSLFGPVTPTARAGIAGEAGPEGIFPLAELPGGELGIRGVLPRGGGQGRGPLVVIINGVDRNVTDRLETRMIEQASSVDFRAREAAIDFLEGRI